MSSLWKDTWKEVKKMVREGVVLTEILPSSTASWDRIPTFQHSGWRGIRFSVTNYSATGHGLPHCEEGKIIGKTSLSVEGIPSAGHSYEPCAASILSSYKMTLWPRRWCWVSYHGIHSTTWEKSQADK